MWAELLLSLILHLLLVSSSYIDKLWPTKWDVFAKKEPYLLFFQQTLFKKLADEYAKLRQLDQPRRFNQNFASNCQLLI